MVCPTSSRRLVPAAVKRRAALSLRLSLDAEPNGAGSEPCLFAEMNKASSWPIKTRLVHKPIRQRLQEENERVLFCIRQTQTTNFARVHIGGRLRHWPAGGSFARIMWLTARQHIARVVEMHDLLQAGKISIVPVGLHEGRIRPLVYVAQRRHPHSRLVVWRKRDPSLVDRRRLAEQMPVAEKAADAAVDERRPCRIGDIAERVGPTLRIVWKPRIGRGSDIAGGEVGE